MQRNIGKTIKKRKSPPYTEDLDERIISSLKDPEVARIYLQLAIDDYELDHNKELFISAIDDIFLAQGSFNKLLDKTDFDIANLCKTLSIKNLAELDNRNHT